MGKKKYESEISCEIYRRDDFSNVKLHEAISDVISMPDMGFQELIGSLKSKRLRTTSKYNPIVIWNNGKSKQTLIMGALYYYESIYNNAEVYVCKDKFTEQQARLIAIEESIILPLLLHSALGVNKKVHRKGPKNKPPTSTCGLTRARQRTLELIFKEPNTLSEHLDASQLAAANRISQILHVSPETACQWLQDSEIRTRKSQKRPRPQQSPRFQHKLF